ncbi:ATP-grasp ribosomal peptide maturase [Streptomyces sp. JJ66]|uniref:ATP-grasp ribosomal peptide maturase n=1 Tax=Streptomyces sp. JJ66 TaxID=2803843 RepID=UPI001C56B8C1|nr:ATP-grasp ribosomal peptide maturase [Streptomyces sp. JJ66]MBW1601632.1 ATP-grasp ribosomal peptide maturase [Streptomyces sp. JJ66]
MTVLVLTRPYMDAVADMVIEELNNRKVPVVRLDTGDFPTRLTLSARLDPGQDSWCGLWRGEHRNLDLGSVRAVYYRRPGRFRLDPRMAADSVRWADSEARAGLGGVLASLRCAWVNHPWRSALAEFSPYALATAARCGLLIPPTLITSDPEEARAFVASMPGQVAAYKAIGTAPAGDYEGNRVALWTTKIRPEKITDAVSLTAHQFQQWIAKKHEVRLTVVGDKLFAGEIHAGSAASRIDFRRDYNSLTYRVCDVPEPIVAGVKTLMSVMGLRYVALDFLVSGDDRWYLVDVNPNGQWGFIPALRAPITQALADLLEATQ